jgi:type I restriction enzyme S subunit
MSFPGYPKYKESGVGWLGQVPDHWEVKPLWSLFTFSKGLTITKEDLLDEGVACVNYGEIHSKYGVHLDPEKHPLKCVDPSWAEKQADALIRKGDFVYADTSEDLEGSGNFTCLINGDPIFAGYHTIIARPRHDLSSSFFAHEFHSQPFRSQIQERVKGIKVFSITQGLLKGICCWQPPLAEQTAIADFLDRETAKIDQLIAEQERLIELLKEKRQAVISLAVTKGLNPEAPMKDSGIEWLGQVPAHWDIRPVKYMAKVGNGSTPSREVPEYWCESGFPWLNSSVVNLPEVTEAEGFVTERALRECHLPIVIPPAVLVGITGQGRTRGMASMLRIEATLNQHLAYVTPKTGEMNVDFLLRVFEMAYLKLRRDSEEAGATKGAITCEQIGNLRIPVPSISEQRDVVVFLDEETAKLDTLTAEAQKAIALLQERRSALISAAATGQIDVRRIH